MEDLVVGPEQYCKPFFDLFLRRLECSDFDYEWVSLNLPTDLFDKMQMLERKILRSSESRLLSEVMDDVRTWMKIFDCCLSLQHELKKLAEA